MQCYNGLMRLIIATAALLVSCTPKSNDDCAEGHVRSRDGHCDPIPSVDGPSSDDTDPVVDTGGDTPPSEDTGAPVTVNRGDCSAATDESQASLELLGQLDTDDGLGPPPILIEILDSDLSEDRFWAVGQGGLMSFDLSGTDPVLANVFTGPAGRFHRLLLVDDSTPLVYATHRDIGLVVVDRSDPSNLRSITSRSMSGLGGMTLANDRLYTTRHDGSLLVFDVTARQTPTLLTTIEAPGHPWTVVGNGDTLYTADNTEGVGVFDRSDPDAPQYNKHVDIGSGAMDLAPTSEHLYVAAGSAGLIIMSTADPLNPVEVARVKTGSPLVDVSVSETTAWVVDHEAVWAVDVSDPTNPIVIGRRETPRFAMTVTGNGSEAWVGDWTAVSGYRAHLDRAQSTLIASPDTVRIPSGTDQAIVQLTNLGASDGRVLSWDASEDDATATIIDTAIGPGSTTDLIIDWPTDASNGLFCVRTNDPTAPEVQVLIQRSDNDLSVDLGTPAPDFELTSLEGETVRLSEQLGHPVLLVYFATW